MSPVPGHGTGLAVGAAKPPEGGARSDGPWIAKAPAQPVEAPEVLQKLLWVPESLTP